jgi:hypothetical protein
MSILDDDTYAGGKKSMKKHSYVYDFNKNEKVMETAIVQNGQGIWCDGGCHS